MCQVKTLKTLEGEFLISSQGWQGAGGGVIVISTILLIYLLDLAEFYSLQDKKYPDTTIDKETEHLQQALIF